jgi:RraA family protein
MRIAMDPRIRPVWRGATVVGPAFTLRTPPGEHAAVREAAGVAPAGSVIVIDAGGDVGCALWGGRMSRIALERDLAGVVVDGAVRDVDEIEALGFPVFAVASVPTPPARERPGEIGVVTSCGGLRVAPGDVVYGDTDGVVVVPAGLHDEIVERAQVLDEAVED